MKKTKPDPKKPDLQRLRPLYALEKLSASLCSDVLADGAIASQFNFNMKKLGLRLGEVTVADSDMFAAFRGAADGKAAAPLASHDGVAVDATVRIDLDGSGIVEIGE